MMQTTKKKHKNSERALVIVKIHHKEKITMKLTKKESSTNAYTNNHP